MSALALPPAPSTFIATTPAQMQEAQAGMILWCDARIETQKHDIADLERTISEAQRVSISTAAWKTRLATARAKMTFYRKVKAALLKGYYIVPPFPVQLFAIRVEASRRVRGRVSTYSRQWEQDPKALEEGIGEWKSPFATQAYTEASVDDGKGGKKIIHHYWPDGWAAGVDFPFKMVKPEIIAAVRGAMESKIFDALGVLPTYKTPDPIVLGQIIPPHRKNDPLMFFVAWWMDPKDL